VDQFQKEIAAQGPLGFYIPQAQEDGMDFQGPDKDWDHQIHAQGPQ
jgi:hypothetical protein